MPGPVECFFGTTLSRGFDFTFGPGVSPSVCSIYTIPHVSTLPQVGPLTFRNVGGPDFVFPECLLEEPDLDVGRSGQYWRLPVKDRRWKWELATTYGSYNLPKPDGSVLREKTPQQLAMILFKDMGETNPDVSRLPNDSRPIAPWQDGVSSAGELDRLCASLACIPTLNPFTNKAEIWPMGQGVDLPPGPTDGSSYTPVLHAMPSKIVTEGGPTLFQATFKLAPVMLDIDDKWKTPDAVSYKPSTGWEKSGVAAGFPELATAPDYTTRNGRVIQIRQLAQQMFMRHYRIVGLADAPAATPWDVTLLKNTDLNPLKRSDFKFFDTLVDEEITVIGPDEVEGLRVLPAEVHGRWFKIENSFTTTLLANFARGENLQLYPNGSSFDEDRGIVSFNEPLILFAPGGLIKPAELRLTCAFNAGRDGVFHRHQIEFNSGSGFNTPTRVVQRQEILRRVIYRYSTDAAKTVADNSADVNRRLQYWMNAAVAEYEPELGGTINYKQFMAVSPDGLTQQVTWSGGGGREPTTVVSRAQRHNRYVTPLNETRDRLAGHKANEMLANAAVGAAIRAVAGGFGGMVV